MQRPAHDPKPARTTVPPAPPRPRPDSMRSTVLLSLIVCPRGGVAVHRHGQGGR